MQKGYNTCQSTSQPENNHKTYQSTFTTGYSQVPIIVPRSLKPCYNCGIPGHTFDVCENRRRDVCNICHAIGHTGMNCSYRNAIAATNITPTSSESLASELAENSTSARGPLEKNE